MCMKAMMDSIPPAFCWKTGGDFGVIPTACPEGMFRFLALCYEKCPPGWTFVLGVCWSGCDPGYDNHPASCYKSLFRWYFKSSYISPSITNFSDRVPCDKGMYRPAGSALCYRDCNNIGMANCGIGACSSDTTSCLTSIGSMVVDVVQGLADGLSTIATLGTSSVVKTGLKAGLKAAGKAAMKRPWILSKRLSPENSKIFYCRKQKIK